MVIWAIHSNVLGDIFGERFHEGFKVYLATFFTEVFIGEVAVHTRSIPVTLDGFAMQYNIHFVYLTKTHQQIPSGPGVISGFGRPFGEDLEFPLAFSNFSVDALMIDTSGKAEVPVFFDDLTG